MNIIPEKQKVWVYLSHRVFTAEELVKAERDLQNFVAGWQAHGTPLKAAFQILYSRFIVISVDEESYAASGCSIDKQVQFIKQLEQSYQVQLLNRLLVAFDGAQGIEVQPSAAIKAYLENGKINENTIVYQTNISTGEAFNKEFKLPLKETWLSKFLVQQNSL